MKRKKGRGDGERERRKDKETHPNSPAAVNQLAREGQRRREENERLHSTCVSAIKLLFLSLSQPLCVH